MTAGAPYERDANPSVEWLELFFDLVVVAAVAVLTHGLQEHPTWGGVGLFAVLFAAVWFGWVAVVMYANVAGPTTRVRTVVVAMGLMAILAAAAPVHFEARANVFAVAFIALRVVVSRSALRTGRLLASWPALQLGGATAPWLAAMWVDEPWKYALWALGLAFDLGGTLLQGTRGSDERVGHLQERYAERHARHERRSRPSTVPATLSVVDVDREHLQERLGLFVIIVLGEVVSQLVLIASSTEWSRSHTHDAVPAFLILVGLWWLTFSYGAIGAPHARMATLEPRFGLPMHLLATVGVVAMAAGFGELLTHPEEELSDGLRWITCCGLALHLAVMVAAAVTGGAPRRWVLGWGLPAMLVPLAVAAFGADLEGRWMLWLLVACIAWLALYGRRPGRSPRSTAAA